MKYEGKTWTYGDNIDTDVIIPARYLNSFDPKELASHCMVDIDESFAKEVKAGDIMVGAGTLVAALPASMLPLPSRHRACPSSLPQALPGSFTATPSTSAFLSWKLATMSKRFEKETS